MSGRTETQKERQKQRLREREREIKRERNTRTYTHKQMSTYRARKHSCKTILEADGLTDTTLNVKGGGGGGALKRIELCRL
jgi:hypothetical protein